MRTFHKGLSLPGVLVTVVIMSIVAVAFSRMFSDWMKATKHTDLTSQFSQVKQDIASLMDCAETFESLGCSGGAACGATECAPAGTWADLRYIALRNKSGNIIGTLQGNFQEDSKKPVYKLGEFSYAAWCTPSRLTIELGRPEKRGLAWEFSVDPLTKRAMDWRALFSTGQRATCEWHLGADPNPKIKRITAPLSLLNNQTTTSVRDTGLGGGGAAPACGGLDNSVGNQINAYQAGGPYPLNPTFISNPRFWTGSATCDPGYTAIAGGLSGGGMGGHPIVMSFAPAGGIAQDSYQDIANPRVWVIVGCFYTKFADDAGAPPVGTSVPDSMYALCQRND